MVAVRAETGVDFSHYARPSAEPIELASRYYPDLAGVTTVPTSAFPSHDRVAVGHVSGIGNYTVYFEFFRPSHFFKQKSNPDNLLPYDKNAPPLRADSETGMWHLYYAPTAIKIKEMVKTVGRGMRDMTPTGQMWLPDMRDVAGATVYDFSWIPGKQLQIDALQYVGGITTIGIKHKAPDQTEERKVPVRVRWVEGVGTVLAPVQRNPDYIRYEIARAEEKIADEAGIEELWSFLREADAVIDDMNGKSYSGQRVFPRRAS